MAYASATDMTNRYDANEIGDLLSDNETPVVEADFSANSKLLALLDDASGEIDAALMVANRYSASDLSDLTGNSLAHLKRITCDITMALLANRRPLYNPEKIKQFEDRAQEHLERLRKGENVFNIQAKKDAGLPTVDGPITVQIRNHNLLRDRTQNYYPQRRMPYNR